MGQHTIKEKFNGACRRIFRDESLVKGLLVGLVCLGTLYRGAGFAQNNDKNLLPEHSSPDLSFFNNCAFVCIDIQPMERRQIADISQEWKNMGYTREDCQAALDFYFQQTIPNAARVVGSCRALGMPIIFVHWGCLFPDGIDLDPAVRQNWMKNGKIDCSQVPYIGHPDSRPDPGLGVQKEDYVLAKSAQDAFPSSNLGYMLENLGVRHIVFVGGHTNPGGCLGKTARSARAKGYSILCVNDATFDAGESTRKKGIASVPFDYVMTTKEFVRLTRLISEKIDKQKAK